MAAYFRRLHPYTCQRLVTLLCVLNKRRTRVLTELKSSTTVAIDGNIIPPSFISFNFSTFFSSLIQ